MMLSYLYWDPDKAVLPFNIPFIDRPILWYGFLFALGFFLGYWVLVYMLRRYFLYFPDFRVEDVQKWPELIYFIRRHSEVFPLSRKLHSQIDHFKAADTIDSSLKKELVAALNDIAKSKVVWPEHKMVRSTEKLLKFGKKHLSSQKLAQLRNRLVIEEKLSFCLIGIKRLATTLTDRATVYMVLGTVIGARLGDVLFYQSWSDIARDPLSIFKTWEGGLASHGAAVGILFSLWLFAKRLRSLYPSFTFLRVLDFLCIPTAVGITLIRVGNFFNQEILGTPTTVPWAVIFGHPADGGPIVPRHPVQLYEAVVYCFVFILCFYLWRKEPSVKKSGRLIGIFLILVFLPRFLIEFLKIEQSALLDASSFLTMGQYLSIPFILLGGGLLMKRAD